MRHEWLVFALLSPLLAIVAAQLLGAVALAGWGLLTVPAPVLLGLPVLVWLVTVLRKRLTGERF